MVMQFLDLLNRYSNLILIIVTTVYVILTWGMVREMRRAREAENEPHLVAALIPFGPLNVKLRIYNTGPGPALSIEAAIYLEPAHDTERRIWHHPALLSGAHEDFRLPGGEYALEALASKYDKLVVDMHWRDTFKRSHHARYDIDFKKQKEGWFKVGLLVPPDDLLIQVGKIKDELSKIREGLEQVQRRHDMSELFDEYKREQNPLWHLWKKVRDLFQ